MVNKSIRAIAALDCIASLLDARSHDMTRYGPCTAGPNAGEPCCYTMGTYGHSHAHARVLSQLRRSYIDSVDVDIMATQLHIHKYQRARVDMACSTSAPTKRTHTHQRLLEIMPIEKHRIANNVIAPRHGCARLYVCGAYTHNMYTTAQSLCNYICNGLMVCGS